uniref:Odorant receptor n=1 Tax=Aulacocentrum confusum TaxID=2767324 RepID=A0A7G8Z936_9HYME|nr:olfactory receptor 17 [Aulacocentrum confusum]
MSEVRINEFFASRQYSLQFIKIIFKYLGIWSIVSSDATKFDRTFTFIIIPILICAMLFTFVPCIVNMIIGDVDASAIVQFTGPLNYCTTNFLKYCILLYQSGTIRHCFDHIQSDWAMIDREEDVKMMLYYTKFSRILTIFCGVAIYISGLSYNLVYPIGMILFYSSNDSTRILVYQGHEIYINTQSSPQYEFLLISHALCGTTLFTLMTGACNMAATFAGHVYGQVDIIQSRLECLMNPEKNNQNILESVHSRVSFIIRAHVRIIKLSSDIENVLSEICLLEVVSSSIIICWLAFHCITGWSENNAIALVTYVTLLLSLCFNIFTFCIIGEILTQKCASLGYSAYSSQWYLLSTKESCHFISFIFMSNRAITITAGGMMSLNMQNFGGIIKTSLVYLNFLRELTD